MRLTQICLRQHIGRMFKRHWVVQGKKTPIDNGSISELAAAMGSLGIQDAMDYVSGSRKRVTDDVPKIDRLSGVPTAPRKSNLNCRTEFLIEGLEHAGNLTKSTIIDHLPTQVVEKTTAKIPTSVHDTIRTTILRDKLFEYRPFKVDPCPMVLSRLLESCERLVGASAALGNKVTKNTYFSVPVKKNGTTVSLETTLDHVVWRKQSPSANNSLVATFEEMQREVPTIAPLDFSASLFANNEDIPVHYRK